MKHVLACALSLILAGSLSVGAFGMGGTQDGGLLVADGRIAEPESYNPDIAMMVTFDYDDQVRIGVTTPAFVEVVNKGPAIDGILRLSITPSGIDEALAYEMPVHVEQEVKATFTLPFRTSVETGNIRVHFIRNGRPIAEAGRARNRVIFTTDMLIGVLSDNPDGMTYRGSLGSIKDDDYNSVDVKPVDLTAKDIPEQTYMLDRFALIVLNHFDLGHLNQEQRDTLFTWVKGGGRLLVDADPNNVQAVRSLQPLIDIQVTGALDALDTELLDANMDEGELSVQKYGPLGQIEPFGDVLLWEADRPLVMAYPVGKGKVFATAFALSDPVFRDRGESQIFERIRGLSAWNKRLVPNGAYSYGSGADGYLRDAVKSIEWLDAPSILWILLMLLGFIVIAAPISYIILSKKDKRDWIWFTAPALALICCAIIIGYGIGRHGVQTVSSVVTVVDSREEAGILQPYSLIGVAAPRQGSYELRMEEDSFPYRLLNRDYYYYNNDLDGELRPAGKPAVRIDVSGYPAVTFEQIRQWSMDTFYLRRNISLGGELRSQIQYHADGARYILKNNTGIDLEDVTVVSQMGYLRIPLLEAGGEKSGDLQLYDFMQGAGPTGYSPYYGYAGSTIDYWSIINELYNRNSYSYYGLHDGDEDDRTEDERREDYLKSRLVNALLDNSYLQGTYGSNYGLNDTSAVWGWSRELGAIPITANGKEVRNDLNRAIILGGVDITYEDNGELLIPLGQISGSVIDAPNTTSVSYGDYSAYFKDGDVTFAFDLPAVTKNYKIDYMLLSSPNAYGNFKPLLYNNSTEDWDEFQMNMELRGDTVRDYIDDDSRVLLKISTDIDDDADLDYSGSEVSIDYVTISVSGKE